MKPRTKLIEVALPLRAINEECIRRKQKAPKGWPTAFHKWWAQRPLAAARAVIFSQMVDDPSANTDLFPSERAQDKERQRLFRLIEELVLWENTTNEDVLQRARNEIWQSWRRACADNVDHPRAKEMFNRQALPSFFDPFAGSGAIPLSAQWLGLESYASDLNPVSVVITKATIEIPPKFAGRPPVNPEARANKSLFAKEWNGAEGLAEDVRYYSKWMREEAERRVGHLYPEIAVTEDMARERPDLKKYVGRGLTVVAWIWARTVRSPNPAFGDVDVPLASTFMLSNKKGKEAYVEPVIEGDGYRFIVKVGAPPDPARAKRGTKLSRRANFECLMSGSPIGPDYIKAEGKAGHMGARMMAIVAEGDRGRVYLAPTPEHEAIAGQAEPEWKPEVEISGSVRDVGVRPYGIERVDQLFTERQLAALATLSGLVEDAKARVAYDAQNAATHQHSGIDSGGSATGKDSYADALSIYLACTVDRMVNYGSSLVGWLPKDNALGPSMPRQAFAMSWDFAEGNPFGKSSGTVDTSADAAVSVLRSLAPSPTGHAEQADARLMLLDSQQFVVSTDPPYFDNVPYADLSDFYYVWLRRSLKSTLPELFATIATPKAEELVAFAHRHGGSMRGAEDHFVTGMTEAMTKLRTVAHPAFPITIYYAFKQSETDDDSGTSSTGWETFLHSVHAAGFTVTGTWPVRTESQNRMRGQSSNVLASSIVLVCRKRPDDAPTATRREFIGALKGELPEALKHLQAGNIAPADLAQAAIGPGMAVYTRYAKIIDAAGETVRVRDALALINELLDETLAEQEGDCDEDTRWAIAWFEQSGFAEGEYGIAETLSKAKNTSVEGLEEAGILRQGRGKVRLLRPDELDPRWDPLTDPRRPAWQAVHQLILAQDTGGDEAAAGLLVRLGADAESARELAYRLYVLCERKKWAKEALAYNSLVQGWPEALRLSRAAETPTEQTQLFEEV